MVHAGKLTTTKVHEIKLDMVRFTYAFDAFGIEGPVVITPSGAICSTATGVERQVLHSSSALRLSQECRGYSWSRFLLFVDGQGVLVNTQSGEVEQRLARAAKPSPRGAKWRLISSPVRRLSKHRAFQRRFEAVAVDSCCLVLTNHKQTLFTLEMPGARAAAACDGERRFPVGQVRALEGHAEAKAAT